MQGNPLVTIGIPFFNAKDYLIHAVKSVFAQNYHNWELFLVDDGSTDDMSEYLSKIKDRRVVLIRSFVNKGLPFRLNQISSMARGKYIARMDADDMMHPERISKQVKFLENNPDIDVVDTGAIVLDIKGRPIGKRGLGVISRNPLDILKWGTYLHASIMARKEWFIRFQYSYEYLRAEDRELWARTYSQSNIFHIPEPLYFYRFSGNVRLDAYLQGYSSERKIILKYGQKMVGYPLMIYLYLRSLIKSMLLPSLSLIGVEDKIFNNKYEGIEKQLFDEIVKILDRIKEQYVPGWP